MTKLITFCSTSHLELLRDFFLPSFLKYPQGIDSLKINHMPQVCPSATYKAPGWDTFSGMKVQKTIEELESSRDGDIVLAADCDLQWFGPLDGLLDRSSQFEIIAQDDGPGGLCGRFIAIRANPKTRAFYKAIADNMQATGRDDPILPQRHHPPAWHPVRHVSRR